MNLFIYQWFCLYFVHSDTPSGAAGWACLGCLNWLGGLWRLGAAENQKSKYFLGNNAGHSPAPYESFNRCTSDSKNIHFWPRSASGTSQDTLRNNHPILFSITPGPLRGSSVWEIKLPHLLNLG